MSKGAAKIIKGPIIITLWEIIPLKTTDIQPLQDQKCISSQLTRVICVREGLAPSRV
jgi:hypothetical protein